MPSPKNDASQTDITSPMANSQLILKAVLGATPDAIFVKNLTGRYIFVNEAAADFIGLKPADMIGKHDLDLYSEAVAREYIEADNKVLTTGEPLTFEGTATGREGMRTYLVSKGVYRGPDGQVLGLFGISHDITERKLAEAAIRKTQLEQQQRQAQKMEAVGRLAGGVAHDFNNLLTVMLGHCELILKETPEDDSRRGSLVEIQQSATTATVLTRQLLAYSRQQVFAPTVLDLNVVIDNIGRMLKRVIREDIEFNMMLSVGLERVKADSGQIEQILMNLVENARDAMPNGGRLTIETSNIDLDEQFAKAHPGSTAGPHVMIAVTDTGTGIAPDVQKRLFEPFFTTKGQGKGTGLGLASVYGVVKQNGGYIGVSSEVGHGTTFTIFWPTTTDVAPSVEEKQEGRAAGAEKILVVEDNEGVRSLVCWALTQRGYIVTSAVDAPDGLRVAEDMPEIDLLLTDIIMPGMSGHALATELSARRPGLTVLFMSGYTDDTVLRHGVEMGTAFLQKPFTARILAHKVRQVLDDAAAKRKKALPPA